MSHVNHSVSTKSVNSEFSLSNKAVEDIKKSWALMLVMKCFWRLWGDVTTCMNWVVAAVDFAAGGCSILV